MVPLPDFYLIFISGFSCMSKCFFLWLNKLNRFLVLDFQFGSCMYDLRWLFLPSVYFLSSVFKSRSWKWLFDRIVGGTKWYSTCRHVSPVSDWHIVSPQIITLSLIERLTLRISLAFHFSSGCFSATKIRVKIGLVSHQGYFISRERLFV